MTQSKLIKTTEAAAILGITPTTLRAWDKNGILKPVFRTKARGGIRFYSRETIDNLCKFNQNKYHLTEAKLAP
jgi:DNA-binding transcriptional MerR regulator